MALLDHFVGPSVYFLFISRASTMHDKVDTDIVYYGKLRRLGVGYGGSRSVGS